MSRTRRRFTPEQKAQIVRRHLANREAVSALAEEVGLQPSQIHTWVNQVLAQADNAFQQTAGNGRAESLADDLEIRHQPTASGQPQGRPASCCARMDANALLND